jgi:hypothetical protein
MMYSVCLSESKESLGSKMLFGIKEFQQRYKYRHVHSKIQNAREWSFDSLRAIVVNMFVS